MLDFTVYKPIRQDALDRAGKSTPEEFAKWFADMIARETGHRVTGRVQDGLVHLHADDSSMEAVSDALEKRGLSHGF